MKIDWNSINPFRRVSPEELMARELDDARRALLEAQTGFDFAKNMVNYNQDRIERLRASLKTTKKSE